MNITVGYMNAQTALHSRTHKKLRSALSKYPTIKASFKPRNKVTPSDIRSSDLVISLGGDGTLLGLSHNVMDNTPVLGINADPKNKEGFLCRADISDLDEKIRKIVCGDFKVEYLKRVQARIGNKVVMTALNEIFFGNSSPFRTSRYRIVFGDIDESHRSSGVIVSSATGSYAWAASVGAKPLPLRSSKMHLIVREHAVGRINHATIKKKLISKDAKVRIVSQDDHNIIIADSIGKQMFVSKGKAVTISQSKRNFSLITFKR